MIESEREVAYEVLRTLSDDTPRYGDLGRMVTGDIITTYLLPVVAHTVGVEAQAAIGFAVDTGLPEAVDVISAADEHENIGPVRNWAITTTERMYARHGLDKIEVVLDPSKSVDQDFEAIKNQALFGALDWHTKAQKRGTDIPPTAISMIRTMYERAVLHNPADAEYAKQTHPNAVDAIIS